MSDQNNTETPPEGGQQTPPAPAPPDGFVSRSVLSQQVAEKTAPLNEALTAANAELATFREAEEKRNTAKLKEAEDFGALEESFATEKTTLQTEIDNLKLGNKKSDLRFLLLSKGLNPEDPKDSFTIDGILARYDGKTEPKDWFEEFHGKNEKLFDKEPVMRQASMPGSTGSGNQQTDVDKLVAGHKANEPWAVNEVSRMNSEGKLTPELAKQLGLGQQAGWGTS